jgi:type I restriction-modification system DNA methylase subunit
VKTESALNLVYDQLDYRSGQLFDLFSQPSSKIEQDDWLNKGEWLVAAKKAGAEKLFFVDNNPVVVFAKCNNTKEAQINCFNKIWSLARPRILFLESGGELSVIDLAQKPIPANTENRELKTKETLCRIKDIAEKLQAYHRDNIESGKVFEQGRFGGLKHRADQSLIADLRTVRKELVDAGLGDDKIKYAHALIGRSIFIRYLEDRKILTEEYFKEVAKGKAGWANLIDNPSSREEFDFSGIHAAYPKVLQDKEFTYALFNSLSKDFNGDMFPDIETEENYIEPEHLIKIQNLLYGNVGVQKNLFFYSYKFDIIPLDLISAIYEEFYHSTPSEAEKKSKARQDGAFYTPPVLAEFVLSRVLTARELKKNPKVLDPACGSGIFLVEAFRRMVRYAWKKKKTPLNFNEVKEILGNQISGIEINEEAARITAFSLYLAMLHYLDPPSILEQICNGNKLPNLLVAGAERKDRNHFQSIRVENAFSVCKEDLGRVDIVVGNPPWGAPGNTADIVTQKRQKVMLDWCKSKSYSIGDKEPSQAFLWCALEFLKDGGRCALLTSAGVLFKHGSKTQAFRNEWMSKVCIDEVFNFTHVRKFFFTGSISPFVMIHFTKEKQENKPVAYWSAKQVVSLKETQAVLFSKYDHNYLVGQDLTDNKTWKVNWFGRLADAEFLKQLYQLTEPLSDYSKIHCVGYKIANKSNKAEWLGKFKTLTNSSFSRYDSIYFHESPTMVEHRGQSEECYIGNRIILKEGIQQKEKALGKIVARYEKSSYSFNHSFHVLKLKEEQEWQYKLLLGCFWSSFSRYFFFLTTANWGVWNDKVLIGERLNFPVKIRTRNIAANRVISIVDKLQIYHPQKKDILHPEGVPKGEIEAYRRKWETELDEAVYDLYNFTKEQRDLIRDCCEVTLPFFYQPYKSIGVMPVIEYGDTSWIQKYAEIFARRWKPYMNNDEVMRADVHIGASGNMLAFEFYPADTGDTWNLTPKEGSWNHILEEIGKVLPKPMGTSQIVLDGVVHAISDDAIIIIKRNEKRFWTRSLAREDVASTLCKRMLETMPQDEGAE